MLIKNDQLYQLTAADVKLIKNKFKKFPIRLTYPESRVRRSTSKHNKLPDKPNSISFPMRAVVKTPTGADTWRYAENKTVGRNGELKYTPAYFSLTGTYILHENDMELIWWLHNKCPYIEGGLNYNGTRPKAVFEDLIGKAEMDAIREEQIATMKAFIYSKKIGLPEKELRQIAKAYFIPGVDDLTFAQVKLALEMEIVRDKLNGIEKFLNLVDGDPMLEARAMLQEALDQNMIRYLEKTHEWVWINESNRRAGTIAQTTVGTDPNEALLEYFKTDKKFQNALRSSLKGQKAVYAEGAAEIIDEAPAE